MSSAFRVPPLPAHVKSALAQLAANGGKQQCSRLNPGKDISADRGLLQEKMPREHVEARPDVAAVCSTNDGHCCQNGGSADDAKCRRKRAVQEDTHAQVPEKR